MTDQLALTIPGVPISQPRQRHRAYKVGERIALANYTPSKHPVQQWKATVAIAWSESVTCEPLSGPVRLEVAFVMPRPQRLLTRAWKHVLVWHEKKPDVDNLLKALKDALTGLAWRDDSQVCQCYCEKRYANADEQPHATITVKEV